MDIISWNTKQIDVSLLLQKWTQTESVFMPTVALFTCQFIIEVFHFSPFRAVLAALKD